jgi:hypothetical protein
VGPGGGTRGRRPASRRLKPTLQAEARATKES